MRRRCRTYARKRIIRKDTEHVLSFERSRDPILPATISIQENSLLSITASDSGEDYSYLWALRFEGELYFSTARRFEARFADNGRGSLRLWTRQKETGIVSKHSAVLRVTNAAPALQIEAPATVTTGESVLIRVRVTDPGLADRAQGFQYIWQIQGRAIRQNEGVSSTMQYRFPRPGNYLISVLVSDQDGATDFAEEIVSVTSVRPPSVRPGKDTPAPEMPPADPPAKSPATKQPSTLPEQKLWEEQMTEFGQRHCATLADETVSDDHRLGTVYYDAQWVFYQIADYTGDSSWEDCAQLAEHIFRDGYAAEWEGRVPGYWNFTDGLLADYLRTGDTQSRDAVIQLSHAAAYTADTTPLEWTENVELSREVAYAIMSYINAEKAGAPRRARLSSLRRQALDHLDQWFGERSAPYMRPFMVALTAQALIAYDSHIGDPAILPRIKEALDIVWKETWLPQAQTFQYTDREHATGGTEPAYDLNLLIAPAFAWVYWKTGESAYLDKADRIFAGGVQNAWLANGKQFNQNYRWTFQYLKWRQRSPD